MVDFRTVLHFLDSPTSQKYKNLGLSINDHETKGSPEESECWGADKKGGIAGAGARRK